MIQGSEEYYKGKVIPELKSMFGFKSVMEVPKLEKVVLNMGLGEAKVNKNVLSENVKILHLIAGQKVIHTVAKQSIAGFKIREGMVIGARVTLRRQKMYDFFMRLIHLNLPRMRDFHGVSKKSFDGQGNYSLGVQDSSVFVEASVMHASVPSGMGIHFVTSKPSDEEAHTLLKMMGLPFKP